MSVKPYQSCFTGQSAGRSTIPKGQTFGGVPLRHSTQNLKAFLASWIRSCRNFLHLIRNATMNVATVTIPHMVARTSLIGLNPMIATSPVIPTMLNPNSFTRTLRIGMDESRGSFRLPRHEQRFS